jgi:DNA-binding GntR family transcriptional regulator
LPIPKKDSAHQRKSAKDLVYETLCDWIIRGQMMPGEKLLDTELADYFNVSRTPVREALQMLVTQKLIKVTPGRATTVADVDKNDIEKCYRPLAEIQGLAARLAAPRLTEAQLAHMEELQLEFEQACSAKQVENAIDCDNKFHEVILRAVDNEYIMEFSNMLLLHVQRIKYHYFHRDMLRKTSAEQHRDILNALCGRDADLAAELMRSHWLYVMERCLREVGVEGIQE